MKFSKLIYQDIKDIKFNPDNPRTIEKDKFDKLVKSIEQAPWMLEIRPIVVDENMMVLGGNMRLKACHQLGLTEIPIALSHNLSEEQKKEFIVKDNIGYGEWNIDLLANQYDIDILQEWGLDLGIDLGTADDSVAEKDDSFDSTAEIETDIVPGDLYQIGEHFLLCGDSTNPDHVSKLLHGEEPYLMVTDPPYGVNYDANWRNDAVRSTGGTIGARSVGKVLNDDEFDWGDSFSLSPAKVAYVYHAGVFSGSVQKIIEDNDFKICSQIIWSKSHFAISRGDYHWMHEPCWYAVKNGSKHNWISDRKQTTIWNIDKPQKNETGHSTQKPLECMSRPISHHSGDVYDPFLGSGTTMVAAHALDRKCYGIEINPKYCQIIINRMRNVDPSIVIKKIEDSPE